MSKLWLVTVVSLVFLGWLTLGMLDVHGNTPANVKEISRHEMFVATQIDAEVSAIEAKIEQRLESLEIIRKNPEQYDNPEFLMEKFKEDIENFESRRLEIFKGNQ